MDASDFVDKLRTLSLTVFSSDTASNIIQKPPAYTRVYLHRLSKAGKITMIERGKYCLPGTDEYTIASRLIPGSYITGYAALEHYKLTMQTTSKIQVISYKYHKAIKVNSYAIKFSKVKRDFIYGYVETSNGPVYAEPEKIFIDDFYLHGKQYYSEEFSHAFETGKIETEKLELYAKLSGKESVIKQIAIALGKQKHS